MIVDHLSEDREVPRQKYALITIVGPHMKQKCDVWGMKIRGVASTIDEAKELSKGIMKYDNNYDIYTVDVGKFFPLVVNSDDVSDVEYQNQELNNLIKSYKENKEQADELYLQRKEEMKSSASVETPVSILYNLFNLEEQIKTSKESYKNLLERKAELDEKVKNIPEDEYNSAINEIKNTPLNQ